MVQVDHPCLQAADYARGLCRATGLWLTRKLSRLMILTGLAGMVRLTGLAGLASLTGLPRSRRSLTGPAGTGTTA